MNNHATFSGPTTTDRERLLKVLAAITFLIFFQAYMVAPLIPELARALHSPVESVSLVVPAYLIPYGLATLIYGFLADRLGVHRVMLASLTAFTILTLATATTATVGQLTLWRMLTGLGASGVVPLALATIGRLYPYEQRGRALGWLFGAMAGGMALGSPLGAMLVPVTSWRGLFILVGLAGATCLVILQRFRDAMTPPASPASITLSGLYAGYRSLFGTSRGRHTYAYVFLNSMFHSGVFTWLGVYLEHRFQLDSTHIGLALLGYGIPGFLLGPVIGRLADRLGRARLIPVGLLFGASAVAILAGDIPLGLVPVVAAVLSLGYDMTQPMFAGIVTTLGGKRPGQAMGLNVFCLFVGSGIGSLVFGLLVRAGFPCAFTLFALLEAVLALAALRVFRSERPSGQH